MSHQYILHYPSSTDPHEDRHSSIFTTPITIEMGDEGSEFLEAKIKEITGEAVKADIPWTQLSGELSIDASVVAGFMFQSDAGDNCTVQVIENEKPPTQILINRDQSFAMFLVAILHHEQWTTSGDFHLRFVRRVPVLDKPCAAPMGGPSTGSAELLSNPSSSTPGESESYSTESPKDESEEQKGDDQTTSTSTNSDNHADLTAEKGKQNGINDVNGVNGVNGVNHTTGTSTDSETDEDLTEEEDYRSIGAAALRGVGGGLIPPGMFPPTP